MKSRKYELQLRKVQDEIEGLLARRPVNDFAPPAGYVSLVSLETDLLRRTQRGQHHSM